MTIFGTVDRPWFTDLHFPAFAKGAGRRGTAGRGSPVMSSLLVGSSWLLCFGSTLQQASKKSGK